MNFFLIQSCSVPIFYFGELHVKSYRNVRNVWYHPSSIFLSVSVTDLRQKRLRFQRKKRKKRNLKKLKLKTLVWKHNKFETQDKIELELVSGTWNLWDENLCKLITLKQLAIMNIFSSLNVYIMVQYAILCLNINSYMWFWCFEY